ncbi:MAG: benzoyl-CoA 2,3-epoxidase subunit BoxA [Gammaproteobacteria bacterium]|nr:benzoyl-CoA 2,3-epoxidase subunit BoxA [Gammaproteobacteria bacterium]
MTATTTQGFARQHLIDPEICIRCNTCEAACPVQAITHDARNYVVDFGKCAGCGACIPPCPTGAIDHWRDVDRAAPFSIEQQFAWDALPLAAPLQAAGKGDVPAEVRARAELASVGQGGAVRAPHSAAQPCVNLYTPACPAVATVTGNLRLTAADASADVRHIVLDFGTTSFPMLEGQTLGILPPGTDAQGKPHGVRLYSVASPREGERPGHNNVALTVKRVTLDHDGVPVVGVASNYLCDLPLGAAVRVVGPYGESFLMPNHPGASLLMICTGTGSAPMRAMTERRRRRIALHEGGELLLFFGARAPEELPYHGPLMKLPRDFIDINLALSRVPGQPKRHVQDLIRARGAKVMQLLQDPDCYVYVCGLKAMESGVLAALDAVCAAHGAHWPTLRAELLISGRLHIETY